MPELIDNSMDPLINLNDECFDLIKQKDFDQKASIFLKNM